jgi:UDP-N-acetylglucosamine 2-epimerase (non-hydrolysing)
MHPLHVAVVFGTRPEAIKLAPLVKRLQASPSRFRTSTIVTAQHREMLDQVLELFSIQPDHDLDIIQPRQTLAQITSRAVEGLDAILSKTRPDWVLVQGDTTTTFVGALAAFYNKIKVGHVEAGLRTNDKHYPYPEEINRQLTTVVADAHFPPTAQSRQNLIAEGVRDDAVWVTGNTVIDALQDVLSWNRPCAHPVLERVKTEQRRMVLVTSHRRENQGEPQRNICAALIELAKRFPDVLIVFPVHLSPAVRDTVVPLLEGQDRIVLLEPLDYFETVNFMKASFLVLSDSGGIQEEAPSLGKPVLVLRDSTERPEGIEAGTVRLVGTDTQTIVSTASALLADPEQYRRMAESANPYGDGKACARILQAIDFIEGRGPGPEPFTSR